MAPALPFPNATEVTPLSRVLLFWIHPLLREGWRGTLDADKMAPHIPELQRCAGVTQRAKDEWCASVAISA